MNVRMHSYEHTHHPSPNPLPLVVSLPNLSREGEIYEVPSPLVGEGKVENPARGGGEGFV